MKETAAGSPEYKQEGFAYRCDIGSGEQCLECGSQIIPVFLYVVKWFVSGTAHGGDRYHGGQVFTYIFKHFLLLLHAGYGDSLYEKFLSKAI